MTEPLYGLDNKGFPRLLTTNTFGLPTQTASYYGITGNGVLSNTGQIIGGTDETADLLAAVADCETKGMLLSMNSRQTGGTGIYLFSQTLVLGPPMSLAMNGNFFRPIGPGYNDGSFTADASGAAIRLQQSTLDPLASTHGLLKSSIEIAMWGPNASNGASGPPLTATGWAGAGYIIGTTFYVT